MIDGVPDPDAFVQKSFALYDRSKESDDQNALPDKNGKEIITMHIYKGIFWWMGGRLLCRKVRCDENGMPLESVEFTSKSGDNFNHKAEWEQFPKKITDGNPFNYYPRGRVEIQRNKATVYLNPSLNRPEVTRMIYSEFGLDALSAVVIKNDGSAHYEALSERE